MSNFMPPLTLLADLSALAATWRHYAGLERDDIHTPANATPEESKARASAWTAAADELDELVRRQAADGMTAEPEPEPEPEPHEVTLEWTEPEPDVSETVAADRREAERQALIWHLSSKQHSFSRTDLAGDPFRALNDLHNGRPHGRGRGKDHTADHGHVTARAAELYRAARKREQKAGAR